VFCQTHHKISAKFWYITQTKKGYQALKCKAQKREINSRYYSQRVAFLVERRRKQYQSRGLEAGNIKKRQSHTISWQELLTRAGLSPRIPENSEILQIAKISISLGISILYRKYYPKNIKNVYAHQCFLGTVTKKAARSFIEEYGFYAYQTNKRHVGLFYGRDLVMLFVLVDHPDGVEVINTVQHALYCVIGGIDKLILNMAIVKIHKPNPLMGIVINEGLLHDHHFINLLTFFEKPRNLKLTECDD
jgi:hypothetical protein